MCGPFKESWLVLPYKYKYLDLLQLLLSSAWDSALANLPELYRHVHLTPQLFPSHSRIKVLY